MALIGVRRTLLKPKPVVVSGSGPVPTWQFSGNSSASSAVQTWSVSLGSPAAQRFLILGLGGSALSTAITNITVAPNVGSTITLTTAGNKTIIDAGARAAIYQCVLLSDADTATTATITITYSTNPFGNTILHLWTVPSGNMSSQTATGTGSIDTTTATTTSTTVNTTAGGFIIAVGNDSINPNATSSFVGSTETFTQRSNTNGTGISTCAGDASGIATNASSNVTCNFSSSGTIRLAAAAWR